MREVARVFMREETVRRRRWVSGELVMAGAAAGIAYGLAVR